MRLIAEDLTLDIGARSSLAYVRGKGIVLNEPSLVAVSPTNGSILAVGRAAANILLQAPQAISAVSPFINGVIADGRTAREMIRGLVFRALGYRPLVAGPRVIISVPPGITRAEYDAFRALGGMAGVRAVSLVASPMAAAIGAGMPVNAPTGNLVIHTDRRATEIAVISQNRILAATSIRLGGDGMDEAIVEHLDRRHYLRVGKQAAERMKIELGDAVMGPGGSLLHVSGTDRISGAPRMLSVSSEEIYEVLRESFGLIADGLLRLWQRIPLELLDDITNRGVGMTGGGALVRGLGEFLAKAIDVPFGVAEDARLCCIRGSGGILDDPTRFHGTLLPVPPPPMLHEDRLAPWRTP